MPPLPASAKTDDTDAEVDQPGVNPLYGLYAAMVGPLARARPDGHQ